MARYVPQPLVPDAPRERSRATQLRSLFVTAGVSSRADGSAYVESERSKVVAAVYGPRPAKRAEYTERAEIRCDVKLASFARSQARKAPGQTDEEKAWSSSLEKTLEAVVLLEKYPKSLIDVFVLVLEADGSVLASAINAASVALAQGGIEMRDVVTAVTVGMSGIGPVVDLTADDEKTASCGMTVAALGNSNAVVQMELLPNSLVSVQGVPLLVSIGLQACSQLRSLSSNALLRQNQNK